MRFPIWRISVCECTNIESLIDINEFIPASYAPDITLKAFEVGGGQGYLDILRKLLVPQSFDGFVHLKNSLIESMLGIEPPLDTSNRQSTDPMVFIQRV